MFKNKKSSMQLNTLHFLSTMPAEKAVLLLMCAAKHIGQEPMWEGVAFPALPPTGKGKYHSVVSTAF